MPAFIYVNMGLWRTAAAITEYNENPLRCVDDEKATLTIFIYYQL